MDYLLLDQNTSILIPWQCLTFISVQSSRKFSTNAKHTNQSYRQQVNTLQHLICKNSQVLPNLRRTGISESLKFSMFFQSIRNWRSKITNYSSLEDYADRMVILGQRKNFLTRFLTLSLEIHQTSKKDLFMALYINPINLKFDEFIYGIIAIL